RIRPRTWTNFCDAIRAHAARGRGDLRSTCPGSFVCGRSGCSPIARHARHAYHVPTCNLPMLQTNHPNPKSYFACFVRHWAYPKKSAAYRRLRMRTHGYSVVVRLGHSSDAVRLAV